MKRLLFVLLITIFLTGCEGTIVDCKDNPDVGGICVDITPPELKGVKNLEFTKGSRPDLLEGVTALDDIDGDITSKIEVEDSVNRNWPGEYLVTYRVTDEAGNEVIEVAVVTIYAHLELLDNIIENSEFNDGLNHYDIFTIDDAGSANIDVVNDELVVEITSVGDYYWAPRVSQSGITFEQGKSYHVSFDAKADDERMIHIQIGELLPNDPWFTDFNPGATDKLHLLTNEYQTFTMTFTMNHETNYNGGILFELGQIQNFQHLTTVYIDNLEVREID